MDCLRRYEAAAYKLLHRTLGNPLRILHVTLAARELLDEIRIGKIQLEVWRQHTPYWNPVDARALSGKYNAKKNRIGFDVEKVAFELWGVNVMRIPGMSRGALLRLVGELGAGFTTKFVDVKHFVSWANLVPNNKISGGALLSSKVPKKKNPVGIIFRQAANTLKAAKNPLGNYFRHMRAKGGHLQAMVATGKKLASIFYCMVQRKVEYNEKVYCNHRKQELQNKVAYLHKRLQRMESELAKCG